MPQFGRDKSGHDEIRRALERAEERARVASSRAIALRTQVEELEEALLGERRMHEQLREQHESLQRLVAVRADRIRDLERSIAEQTRHASRLERDRQALQARLEDVEARVGASADASQDDLRAIHGIGPKLEQRLHEAGITQYRQIAGWSDDDVDRIAEAIGVYAKRIRNAGWVEAAKRQLGIEVEADPESDSHAEESSDAEAGTEADPDSDTEAYVAVGADPVVGPAAATSPGARQLGSSESWRGARPSSVWPAGRESEAPPKSIPPPKNDDVDDAW